MLIIWTPQPKPWGATPIKMKLVTPVDQLIRLDDVIIHSLRKTDLKQKMQLFQKIRFNFFSCFFS